MSENVNMSVSSPVVKGDKKLVYVMFSEADKSAEFEAPGGELVKNVGFSDEDITILKDYILNNWETIFGMAKEIDPMKAFLEK